MEPAIRRPSPLSMIRILRHLGVVCWGLAVVLGLRQSAWERFAERTPFCCIGPEASTIFATKIATGVGLVQLVAVAPLLWYGLWASMADTHPGPFEWSMTDSAWCPPGSAFRSPIWVPF